MEHAIEYLEAELDSLKDVWREDTQRLRDVYISRIIDVKEALCHLKKISERKESTDHSDKHDSKALNIAVVSISTLFNSEGMCLNDKSSYFDEDDDLIEYFNIYKVFQNYPSNSDIVKMYYAKEYADETHGNYTAKALYRRAY